MLPSDPTAGPSRPLGSIIYRSKSVFDFRSRKSGSAAPGSSGGADAGAVAVSMSSPNILSRSSTPGYLPPRYRSASVAESSDRARALEFERKTQQALMKCMTSWDSLLDKYGGIGVDEDDEVDLLTGEIIVDRGWSEKYDFKELGDMLVSPDKDESESGGDSGEESAETEKDEDPDADELASWSDDERSRRRSVSRARTERYERPPATPGPSTFTRRAWTREDDDDLAAFKRMESERRALNDEEDLDSAAPVSLLYKSHDEAKERSASRPPAKDVAIKPWLHGTRVYDASSDLHQRSRPRSSDRGGTSRRAELSPDSISDSDTEVIHSRNPSPHSRPTVAPARQTVTALERPSANFLALATVAPLSSKAAGKRPQRAEPTLGDLFTPTPSPPPSSSLPRQITHPPGRPRQGDVASTARPSPVTDYRSGGRPQLEETSLEDTSRVYSSKQSKPTASRKRHSSAAAVAPADNGSWSHETQGSASVLSSTQKEKRGARHGRSSTGLFTTASSPLSSLPAATVDSPIVRAAPSAPTPAGPTTIDEQRDTLSTGKSRRSAKSVQNDVAVQPLGATTADHPISDTTARTTVSSRTGTKQGRQRSASRIAGPGDTSSHEHFPPADTTAVTEDSRVDTTVSSAGADPAGVDTPTAIQTSGPARTPPSAGSPRGKRAYARRTPRSDSTLLPIPPASEVDPPEDRTQYFPNLHHLSGTTVRYCRLCRAAPAGQDERRARSYYCRGRQNALWCTFALNLGEEITPTRDRNKAVKERKRAVTEALKSMPPEDKPTVGKEGDRLPAVSADASPMGTAPKESDAAIQRSAVTPTAVRNPAKVSVRLSGRARALSLPQARVDSAGDRTGGRDLAHAEQAAQPGGGLEGSGRKGGKRRARRSVGDGAAQAATAPPAPTTATTPSASDPTTPARAARTVKIARGRSASARREGEEGLRGSGRTSTPPPPPKAVALAPPSSAKKRKRFAPPSSPLQSARRAAAEPLTMTENDIFSPSPPPSGLDESLPPSSPPSSPYITAGTGRTGLPTPSPTASAEQSRDTPASSPLAPRLLASKQGYSLPTPPLSAGHRSVSVASDIEYTLPETLPRPRLRSILRQSSSTPYLYDLAEAESSDKGRSSSAKRARFSLQPRSPTHDDVSFHEGDLAYPSDDWDSSPVKSWHGASSSSIGFDPLPRELEVRAADAGVQLTGHTGRLPTHLLNALVPSYKAVSAHLSEPTRAHRKSASISSATCRSGLMLPPPIPGRTVLKTPTRPSPLKQASTAPVGRRYRQATTPDSPVEEVNTPIVFRKALPLYVRASMARERSWSRSVSVAPRAQPSSMEVLSSDDEAHPSMRTRAMSRSRSTPKLSSWSSRSQTPVIPKAVPDFADMGPDWGLDEDAKL